MENNFSACLKFVLQEEGGNDDDPHDHGGRTSRGIIQREYWADQDRRGVPHSDVWRATDAEIQNIYHQYYWNPWCNQLPDGIDLIFFDFGVNSGRVQATRTLQRALGNLPVDGVMGPRTLAAVEAYPDITELVSKFSMWRERFYRALGQFNRYGHGWLARNNRCQAMALGMAKNALAHTGPTSDAPKIDEAEASTADSSAQVINASLTTDVSPKAISTDVSQPMISPEQAAGSATGLGAASGLVNQAQGQLAPYQWSLSIVQYILIGLAIISIGLMIYGLIHRKKTKEAI